jgi:hypothetical protein
MDLWMKHHNPVGAANKVFHETDVADPIASAEFWRCPHPQSPIEPYDVDGHKLAPKAEQDTVKPAKAEESSRASTPTVRCDGQAARRCSAGQASSASSFANAPFQPASAYADCV